MLMCFLNEAVELQKKMVMWRSLLHQNAEIGTELPMTSGIVKRVLEELNISWKNYTKYGVVGVLGKNTNRKYFYEQTWMRYQ